MDVAGLVMTMAASDASELRLRLHSCKVRSQESVELCPPFQDSHLNRLL